MELPLDYLTVQTTLEDAIADNLHDGTAFGHSNDDWQRLLAQRKPGDELWYFEPPNKHCLQLWGLALVRNRRIISTVITALT